MCLATKEEELKKYLSWMKAKVAKGVGLRKNRNIVNNAVATAGGGQPLLWQHLFWFYSHPAVYIMILPAMGMVSDILTCFARKYNAFDVSAAWLNRLVEVAKCMALIWSPEA